MLKCTDLIVTYGNTSIITMSCVDTTVAKVLNRHEIMGCRDFRVKKWMSVQKTLEVPQHTKNKSRHSDQL